MNGKYVSVYNYEGGKFSPKHIKLSNLKCFHVFSEMHCVE